MLDDGSSSMPENGMSSSRKKTETNTGRIKCSQCRKVKCHHLRIPRNHLISS